MFTAVQAAQKNSSARQRYGSRFTAVQAAQKLQTFDTDEQILFTAVQAAQKVNPYELMNFSKFTAVQAGGNLNLSRFVYSSNNLSLGFMHQNELIYCYVFRCLSPSSGNICPLIHFKPLVISEQNFSIITFTIRQHLWLLRRTKTRCPASSRLSGVVLADFYLFH